LPELEKKFRDVWRFSHDFTHRAYLRAFQTPLRRQAAL
jgi:hypothetical protein